MSNPRYRTSGRQHMHYLQLKSRRKRSRSVFQMFDRAGQIEKVSPHVYVFTGRCFKGPRFFEMPTTDVRCAETFTRMSASRSHEHISGKWADAYVQPFAVRSSAHSRTLTSCTLSLAVGLRAEVSVLQWLGLSLGRVRGRKTYRGLKMSTSDAGSKTCLICVLCVAVVVFTVSFWLCWGHHWVHSSNLSKANRATQTNLNPSKVWADLHPGVAQPVGRW